MSVSKQCLSLTATTCLLVVAGLWKMHAAASNALYRQAQGVHAYTTINTAISAVWCQCMLLCALHMPSWSLYLWWQVALIAVGLSCACQGQYTVHCISIAVGYGVGVHQEWGLLVLACQAMHLHLRFSPGAEHARSQNQICIMPAGMCCMCRVVKTMQLQVASVQLSGLSCHVAHHASHCIAKSGVATHVP